MDEFSKAKEHAKGMVALGWLAVSTILEAIMLLAYAIWQTKIAIFLLGVSTLLFLITLSIFQVWKHRLKKYKK